MGEMRLARDRVLAVLNALEWRDLGVEWVVLYGSLARRSVGGDVDLLVSARGPEGDPQKLLDLALKVSEALGVDPSLVDIVDSSSAPCAIVKDAWRHGVVVYESSRGRAREWLLVRVKVCHDYDLARRKLRITETAAEAMRRRWG